MHLQVSLSQPLSIFPSPRRAALPVVQLFFAGSSDSQSSMAARAFCEKPFTSVKTFQQLDMQLSSLFFHRLTTMLDFCALSRDFVSRRAEIASHTS